MLTEEDLDEIGARLAYTPWKSPTSACLIFIYEKL
jgi:hypothetical protein